jgi:hypothetical protein
MSPVRYELGFYIPEDGVLHNHAVKTSNLTLPEFSLVSKILTKTSETTGWM